MAGTGSEGTWDPRPRISRAFILSQHAALTSYPTRSHKIAVFLPLKYHSASAFDPLNKVVSEYAGMAGRPPDSPPDTPKPDKGKGKEPDRGLGPAKFDAPVGYNNAQISGSVALGHVYAYEVVVGKS